MQVALEREHAREQLAALSPGGSPRRAIAVASAAVIEGRAGAMACPQCGGLYRIHDQARWSLFDCLELAATLALLTYTYSIGRLFAPSLALGLLLFATRERIASIFKTWIAYGVMLLPLLVFMQRNPGALTSRFELVSYIKPESTLSDIAIEFITHYLSNLSLIKLLLTGDPNMRHHIWGMGSMFVATVVLVVIGLGRALPHRWRDPWWRFVLYGLAVSVVPASLTNDDFHSLRLIPVPIFLLLLTVPALVWLSEDGAHHSARRVTLFVLLGLTLLQAGIFQRQFHQDGPLRGNAFEEVYPQVFAAVMDARMRPIYLKDRGELPGYIHAYWYGALHEIDASQFIRLPAGEQPPAGALVVGTDEKCTNCQVILRLQDYIVYRTF